MASLRLVSVVIPTRRFESVGLTIETLMEQTVQDMEIHVIVDREKLGQSWARNRGAELARGDLLLFSDSDLIWQPQALEQLWRGLRDAQQHDRDPKWKTAYAYGAYQFTERVADGVARRNVMCKQAWSWETLRQWNYISTMALIDGEIWRQERFAFDESLHRLEDWDLWLQMGARGYRGAYVDEILFRTEIKPGVSHQNPLTHEEAERVVRQKHGLEAPR